MFSERLKKEELFKEMKAKKGDEKKQFESTLTDIDKGLLDTCEEGMELIAIALRGIAINPNKEVHKEAEDYLVAMLEKYEQKYYAMSNGEVLACMMGKVLDCLMGA